MIGRPGSTLWLLGHELRMARRRWGRRGKQSNRWLMLAFTLGVPLFLTVVGGIPLGRLLSRVEVTPTPVAAAIAAFMLIAFFTLMLSQTLTAAVDALYERGDLDLLFSSPLRPQRVMTVRFLAVAAGVFWIFGYFLTGPLVAIAVQGHLPWLAGLVVLFALALASAGAGLLLAASLFRVIGPRRTRTAAQVTAAVIGASFFLAAQAHNILGEGRSQSLWQTIMRLARDPQVQVPGLDWPLRAMLGEPLPLAAVVAAGAGLFWLASAILGPRFAADAAAAAGAGRGATGRTRTRFGAFAEGAFVTTLRKELRLLVRDPALLAQVLMRVLYMLPVGFLLLRQAGRGDDLLFPGSVAALCLIAGQVAGSLAWITVSAEDAPDLLASSPSPVALVRRGKLAAAALPLAVLLAPVLLPLLVLAPLAGAAASAGCAASIAAAGLMNVWWQRPGKRSEFRRRGRASWFVTIVELLVGALIALTAALIAMGLPWALAAVAPAALAGLILLALRRSDTQIAEALRVAS